jgi:hypothetical protein
LIYKDGIRPPNGNIHSLFGTAMHQTLQEMLNQYYNVSKRAFYDFDYADFLFESMKAEYEKSKSEGLVFTDKIEFAEFYNDGLIGISYFVKHVDEYFKHRGFKLVGVETKLSYPLRPNLSFTGYIDVIIYDVQNESYRIIDLKKSYRGWGDNDKLNKRAQLQLYKHFYSLQFNVPAKNIDVEFIIFKQKLFVPKDPMYRPKNIQRFEPPTGPVTLKKVVGEFNAFIEEAYDVEGFHREAEYKASPSKKACNFCPFKTKKDLCKHGR